MDLLARLLVPALIAVGTAFAQPSTPAEAAPKDDKVAVKDKPKEEAKSKPDEKSKASDKAKDEKKPKKSETKHSVTIDGQKIEYTATAGLMPLKDKEGKTTTAQIFYIAYTKDVGSEAAKRPLTFAFNGGPGSSSVWMHMGLLGPKRVKLQDDGFAVPPPYEFIDNEYSLLDETDLVFIDPVGTGYSRSEKPEDGKKFWGVKEDAESVAEFIRLYVTKNTRWSSPKFLIGESYGTTRAAALSGELQRAHRMNLNGIMLVSTVLNFQTIRFGEGNDLPYVLFLPTYTATAWYHKKLPADLQKLALDDVLKQAEAFAIGDYNQALLLGTSLDSAKRAAIVKQAARLTGLTESFVERSNLRVSMSRFGAELLRDQNLNIGRFDSRFTSYVRDPLANSTERDPSADAVGSVFASTFNQYVRGELKYREDLPYQITSSIIGDWNWGEKNGFVNVANTLAEALTANPFMKVHVSCGFYDLATPWLASRYTFNHLNASPALAKNITIDDYTAGHMMYLNIPDLKKQKGDLAKFIKTSCPE
ncbi:MAG: peptidase S10 [Prosthecobacter sp.]|nr:peptidase S10 [Prosthecobacter sp.]